MRENTRKTLKGVLAVFVFMVVLFACNTTALAETEAWFSYELSTETEYYTTPGFQRVEVGTQPYVRLITTLLEDMIFTVKEPADQGNLTANPFYDEAVTTGCVLSQEGTHNLTYCAGKGTETVYCYLFVVPQRINFRSCRINGYWNV